MTTVSQRFVVMPNGSIPERRRSPRLSTAIPALLRSSYGDETEILLADVSIHGCSVRTEATWLRSGAFISIKLEDDPLLQGIVRWVHKGAAGVEFIHPFSAEHVEWHALTRNILEP